MSNPSPDAVTLLRAANRQVLRLIETLKHRDEETEKLRRRVMELQKRLDRLTDETLSLGKPTGDHHGC